MVFKYHFIKSKENPNFLYIFDESKKKLLATIDEVKKTEKGYGEFSLVINPYQIILDIAFVVRRAKEGIIETEEERDYVHQQKLKISEILKTNHITHVGLDMSDGLLITDILWSYRDNYCKQ